MDFNFSYKNFNCKCNLSFGIYPIWDDENEPGFIPESERLKFHLKIRVKSDIDQNDKQHILYEILKYVFILLKYSSARTTDILPRILDSRASFCIWVYYKCSSKYYSDRYTCTWGENRFPNIELGY